MPVILAQNSCKRQLQPEERQSPDVQQSLPKVADFTVGVCGCGRRVILVGLRSCDPPGPVAAWLSGLERVFHLTLPRSDAPTDDNKQPSSAPAEFPVFPPPSAGPRPYAPCEGSHQHPQAGPVAPPPTLLATELDQLWFSYHLNVIKEHVPGGSWR